MAIVHAEAANVQKNGPVSDVNKAMSPSDKNGLVDLYVATNGARWEVNTGWNSDDDACSWARVTCFTVESGQRYSYYQLDLSKNNLQGTLPSSLRSLTLVKNLNMASNALSSTIPSDISGMKSLLQLVLDSNELNGTLPSALGSMLLLNRLSANNNKLEGAIPAMGRLKNLLSVNLAFNSLSGNPFGAFPTNTVMNTVRLSFNYLSGEIPKNLQDLFPSLTNLQLDSNLFSGSLNVLIHTANLTTCNISGNPFICPLPAWSTDCLLTKCSDCSSLSCEDCDQSGCGWCQATGDGLCLERSGPIASPFQCPAECFQILIPQQKCPARPKECTASHSHGKDDRSLFVWWIYLIFGLVGLVLVVLLLFIVYKVTSRQVFYVNISESVSSDSEDPSIQ